MSKVKIQGNASGTGVVTLTAPNTNTDRTITLPDGTGTLVQADASGNVGIGTTSPDAKAHFYSGTGGKTVVVENPYNDYAGIEFKANGLLEGRIKVANDGMHFYSDTGATSSIMRLTSDGRGLSQFTAKAWVNFDPSTTTIRDSFNISSLTNDSVAGDYINFTTAMPNSNYCVAASANGSDTFNNGRFACASSFSTSSVLIIGQHAYNSASATDYMHAAIFSN